MTIKRCTQCNSDLDESHFRMGHLRKDGSRGLRSWCIHCQRVYGTGWWRRNAKRLNAKRNAKSGN